MFHKVCRSLPIGEEIGPHEKHRIGRGHFAVRVHSLRDHVITHARDLAAHGAGVIYIGHNLTEILRVADRIVVMFRGQTVHTTAAKDTTQEALIKYMTGYNDSEKAA